MKMPVTLEEFNSLDAAQKTAALFEHVHHLYEAFPEKDPEAHCDYHSAKIRAAQAEERFWNELKLDLAKKGAWGLLIIVLGLLVVGMSAKLGIRTGG